MNLRQPPRAQPANVISNPFGGGSLGGNDTNAGVFEQPPAMNPDDSDNIFVSDNPTHSGIQMGDDEGDMFIADPTPSYD